MRETFSRSVVASVLLCLSLAVGARTITYDFKGDGDLCDLKQLTCEPGFTWTGPMRLTMSPSADVDGLLADPTLARAKISFSAISADMGISGASGDLVPRSGVPRTSSVDESSTLALAGVGMALLGAARMYRRRWRDS